MTTLPISDPNFVPDRDVERIWAGKDRHYNTTSPQPYDRVRALSQLKLDGGPASDSVLARAITRFGPHGRVIPGLIPNWPILKHQERPWVVAQRRAATEHSPHLDLDDEVLDVILERVEAVPPVEDPQLEQIRSGFVRLLHLAKKPPHELNGVAAVLAGGYVMLDVFSDGRLDTMVRWCKLIAVVRD